MAGMVSQKKMIPSLLVARNKALSIRLKMVKH